MNAILVWTPTLYIRTWGWSASSIGYTFGICLLLFGTTGAASSGRIADRLRRKGNVDAALRMTILVTALTGPAAMLVSLMPSAVLSVVFLAMLSALMFAYGTVVLTALQLVIPNELRAQVTAASAFVVNLVGMIVGPTAVALMTDYVFQDDFALRYSFAIVVGIAASLGTVIFWSGLKSYRANITGSEKEAGTGAFHTEFNGSVSAVNRHH
jgi:MFS family permease